MATPRSALLALILIGLTAAPALAQSSTFGNAVVINGDELIIGEPNNNFRSGVVYVYRKNGGAWQEAAQLTAADAERADGFGAALAMSGNTLVVAQRGGRLHAFSREGTAWRPAGELAADGVEGTDPGCNQYGYCGTDFGLALAASGDWLLVGDPGARQGGRGGRGGGDAESARPGVVHVYQRGANGTYAPSGRLVASDGTPGDRFGFAIAIADGRALIGAPTAGQTPQPAGGGRGRGGRGGGEPEADAPPPTPLESAGRVYEFVLENGAWRESGRLQTRPEANATFGSSLTVRGDVAIVGAPGSGDGHGAAFLYRRDPESGQWAEQSRLVAFNGIRGDRFGASVAIQGDEVWVGAPVERGLDTGMVYVFEGLGDGELLASTRRLSLDETAQEDLFGDRIVTSANIAAVSATGVHHGAGAVVVYERGANGAWGDGQRLISAPDALPALTGEERVCTDGKVGPFDCSEIELLAYVPTSMLRADGDARGVRTNDNWGWTDPETGREYALVGRNDGTAFVDITDPTNPVLVGDLPKTPNTPRSQLWRDIKVYKDHAFIVADGAGNHGMQVFDLRKLRNVASPPALFEPDVHYDRVASVHNIAINEETGFAYLVGAGGGGESCGGGLHMIDIREPLNPQFMGCFRDERGTHDVQCAVYQGPDQDYKGREICLKSNAQQFAISDVTDKANPVAISRASHPNPAYLHQGWLTEDHRYFFMDDESDVIRGNVETTRTLIWDLTDLDDPVLAKEFMGSLPASAHNLYIKGNFAYQANYRYGLHILDISDPLNPREIGTFDTSPYHVGPGFSGAWSNYPFFESGTVIVTSLQEGLFVVRLRRISTN